ncbi:uncharacterized protein LOC121927174 [Sceloporus undulatus]|uniref:uncharacterized protein LOC121927174 n=1 Tax=Sceloporus undulatus TaxID=8520 RepID=UPI001C4A82E6|nr:uncharacterized protein LOC121927174 [Sceloporus undulatus]
MAIKIILKRQVLKRPQFLQLLVVNVCLITIISQFFSVENQEHIWFFPFPILSSQKPCKTHYTTRALGPRYLMSILAEQDSNSGLSYPDLTIQMSNWSKLSCYAKVNHGWCPDKADEGRLHLSKSCHLAYIVFSIVFMLISAVACYGSVIFGTLCLTTLPPSKKITWPTLTITLCFMSGFTGGIGLFNFMRSATEEPNTFLSWSLAPGWSSVIVVSMAGVCHFVAKNWEEEELAETLFATSIGFTLQEDCMARSASEYAQYKMRNRRPESDTPV